MGRQRQPGSECVYFSSSSGPRTPVLVLGDDVPVCVCVHTIVQQPTYAAEIDAMLWYSVCSVLGAWGATVVITQKNMPCPHGRCYYPLTFIVRPLSSWRRGTARLLAHPPLLEMICRGAMRAQNGRGNPDRGASARCIQGSHTDLISSSKITVTVCTRIARLARSWEKSSRSYEGPLPVCACVSVKLTYVSTSINRSKRHQRGVVVPVRRPAATAN